MNLECHVCTARKIATSFHSLDDLQAHLFMSHHDGPLDVFQFVCHKCDYKFGTEYRLLRHEEKCGRESESEEAMENIRHQLRIYEMTENSLKYNMAKNGQCFEKMDLQCHDCDESYFATSFCSLDELIAHMFSNHQAGPFQIRCHKCDFKFGTEYRLLRHKETCGSESRSAEDTAKIRYKFQMYELLEESLTYNMTKLQTAGMPSSYPSITETTAANPTQISNASHKKIGTLGNVKPKVQVQTRSNDSATNTQSNVKTEDVDTFEPEILCSVEIRKRKAPSKPAERTTIYTSGGIAQQNVTLEGESSNLQPVEEAKKKRMTEESVPESSQYTEPAQIPRFNSARDQEKRKTTFTSTAAKLTNRIHVYGPCLHSMESTLWTNPRDHQREDLLNLPEVPEDFTRESFLAPLGSGQVINHQKEDLRTYFGQFGKVMNVSVKLVEYLGTDSIVTFANCDSATKCIKQRYHKILGRDFRVQRGRPSEGAKRKIAANLEQSLANPSNGNVSAPIYQPIQIDQERPTNRIFVCGPCLHPEEVDPRIRQNEDLRAYFGQFGAIVNISDHKTGHDDGAMKLKSKVSFENCDSAVKCIQQCKHKIGGSNFIVWDAAPSKSMKKKLGSDLEQSMPGASSENVSTGNDRSNVRESAESNLGNKLLQGTATKAGAKLTNRIHVNGPVLHPERTDPRQCQREEVSTYFSQYGKIMSIHIKKSNKKILASGTTLVTFENCDPVTRCMQEGEKKGAYRKHKICGHEFVISKESPSEFVKKILRQNMSGPSSGNVSAQNIQSNPPAETNLGNQCLEDVKTEAAREKKKRKCRRP